MEIITDFINEHGLYDYGNYAEFFADHILHWEKYKRKKLFDGLSYDQFLTRWNNDIEENLKEMACFSFVKKESDDYHFKRLDYFQGTLSGLGINIDYPNLFFLCKYILAIIKSGYVALLRPTPCEILSFNNDIEKVAFTYSDGSVAETDSRVILNSIIEALNKISDADDSEYEVEKLVEVSKVSNPEIFEVKFVYYLTRFLREKFPNAKRRINSRLDKEEQSLVMYLLYYFGISKTELSLYRYRQLWMYSRNIKERIGYSYIEKKGKKGFVGLVPISFVKFEDWKGKKLSYIEENGIPYKMKLTQLKVGDTVVFSKVTKLPKITDRHKK